ncbi:MAG: peptidoglycan-binding protein [Rhodobacteraceae bacterium]|nr:peptidoglycan-binding protein [Paracoccaceae bacterium]MCF8514918.1 peptidoglycan-binding protein [Paracoccaceae bacterium]MCF8519162.1 peptidoglycan-binding protein [Paracoccaceae bacterium]
MLPTKFSVAKNTAIAAVTALSLALTAAAPAHALGKNERNFLKGVAATLIIGAIINDAQARSRPALAPQPQPHYGNRGHRNEYRNDYRNEYRDEYRDERRNEHRTTGRVIGTSTSIYATHAAQTFGRYSGNERRAIQRSLRAYGYYNGGIDGAFGPGTYNAVLAYARDTGGAHQVNSQAGSFGIYDSLIR